MRRLALQLDAAVVVVNQMGSRFRSDRVPMLHQALSGWTWESGLSSRVVLYFVWVPGRQRGRVGGMSRVRVAEVVAVASASRTKRRVAVPYVVLKVSSFCCFFFFFFFLATFSFVSETAALTDGRIRAASVSYDGSVSSIIPDRGHPQRCSQVC
jgi:hypothetical protein